MKRLIIEELKRYDRNNLSFYRLIYSHFDTRWIIISVFSTLLGFIFMGIFLVPFSLNNWWSVLISLPILIFSVVYTNRKSLIIIKKLYNLKYQLEVDDKWNFDTIQRIRLEKFRKHIKKIGVNDKERLIKVIECLDFDSASSKYNYTLSITSVVLVVGALLSGFIAVSLEKTINLNDFYLTNKIFLGMAFMLLFMIFYIEKFIIKEIILRYRNRNKRLIQTIYNYLIKK